MAEGIRMKTIEENIRKMEQLQQQHARSLNHSTRMKTIEENIRKMEQLQQQHARSLNHWMEQWWPSTNQNMTESLQETQFSARAPSNLGVELNLEAKSAKQERGILVFPSYGPVEPDPTSFSSEISELLSLKIEENQSSVPSEIHQDAFIKNTSAYQVIRKSHQQFEDDQPDSLQEKRSSASTPSNLGIDLNFKLGLDDRRALSPSTEQQKSDFRRGISTFPQTEFLDFDGMQLSWVRSVDGFDGIIEWVADSVETIELNLVDSMEFLETPSARKVFVEMPSRIVMLTALVDEKITNENGMEFLALQLPYDRGKLKHRMVAGIAVFDPGIDDRHECISWDFAIFVVVYIEVEIAVDRRNWVFDPGKGIELSLHIEMVETLGFLVSDPSGELFSLKCAEYGFPQGMGKVVCCSWISTAA